MNGGVLQEASSPPALTEPDDVRVARAAHLNVLLLADRNLAALESICATGGLTHQRYVVLWTLCLADEPARGIPLGAIADGLLNRASDVTRLVDRLERDGLAERLANPDDRRSVLVRATAAGHRAFAAVTPRLQRFHREQWSNLADDEIGTLDRLLAKALWGGDGDG